MKLIHDLTEIPALSGSVVTDGMFDGVHLGHQRILKQVVNEAKAMGLPSVLLTYWPHPRHVLPEKGERLKILTTLEEKAEIVARQGIDYMLVIPFNYAFSRISHEKFVKEILSEKLQTRKIIIGYDHRFGLNRLGNVGYLKEAGAELGFEVIEIGKQEIEDIAISSTKIRYSLQHHLIETAGQFLGRNYSLSGTVVKGDQRGRLLGYPTANLDVSETSKLVPADGVYATWVVVDGQKYGSMTNIGFRPTVDGLHHKIESHLFDFEGDLYGRILTLEFVSPIREEMKFAGLDALKEQLALDEKTSRMILAKG